MGGLAGCLGADGGDVGQTLARMRVAPLVPPASGAPGPALRRAAGAPVLVFGDRDADLAEDAERGDLVALAGYARLRGRPADAATLLAGFRAEGERLLDALSGELALAVRIDGRFLIARDALGARPLYVAELPGGAVAFSTSLFALIRAGASPEPDHAALVQSLALGYPVAPATAVASVQKLAPGEVRELSPRRRARRWFTLRAEPDAQRTLDASTRAVDRAVTEAVAAAIPPPSAGARIAAFLSGGLDASLILSRLREAGAEATALTLSFGAALPGELRYARAAAEHLGVRHHVVELSARAFCDALPPTFDHLEDALTDPTAAPTFVLAREAAKHAEVVFTGDGGAQVFGGPRQAGMILAHAYGGSQAAPSPASTYLALQRGLWGDFGGRALQPGVLAALSPERLAGDLASRFFADRAGSFGDRVAIADIELAGGHDVLVRAATMIGAAHDLAVRSPLFDRALVALALTLPPWQKASGAADKLTLRRAARRSLPPWIVDRPPRGMTPPLGAWFAGDLGALARDVLTERAVRERGLFRWAHVEALLAHAPRSVHPARLRATHDLFRVLATELHLRAVDRLAEGARAPLTPAAPALPSPKRKPVVHA